MMGQLIRSISYLIIAFFIVLYGLPRLPLLHVHSTAFTFSIIWLGFALLIIGAHLYQIIHLRERRDSGTPPVVISEEQHHERGRTQEA